MKYNQLNKKAQLKAISDYKKGWEETHPNDTIPDDDIHDILLIDLIDDYDYDEKGNTLEEH